MTAMAPEKPKKPKKPNGGKKPSRSSTMPLERVHIPDDLHAAFMRYIDESDPKIDKSEALRSGLRMLLRAKGYWPPKPGGLEQTE